MGASVLPASVERSLKRVEEVLFAADTAEAVLARRAAGRPAPDDEARAAELADSLVAAQAEDGSWDGELLRTAETLVLLHGLPPSATPSEPVTRALDWLRRRNGAPGRFGDGCSAERHAAGACHHFLGGFFSPGPPEPPLDGVRLGSGAWVPGDAAARLAASCAALHAVRRWDGHGFDVALQLDGLRRLAAAVERWAQGPLSPAAYVAALDALLDAAPAGAHDEVVEHGLGLLCRAQRADGSWPDADNFQVIELLLAAARHGAAPDPVDAALARGAALLAVAQQQDGTWGVEAEGRRTLIGWRTLRHAVALNAERAS